MKEFLKKNRVLVVGGAIMLFALMPIIGTALIRMGNEETPNQPASTTTSPATSRYVSLACYGRNSGSGGYGTVEPRFQPNYEEVVLPPETVMVPASFYAGYALKIGGSYAFIAYESTITHSVLTTTSVKTNDAIWVYNPQTASSTRLTDDEEYSYSIHGVGIDRIYAARSKQGSPSELVSISFPDGLEKVIAQLEAGEKVSVSSSEGTFLLYTKTAIRLGLLGNSQVKTLTTITDSERIIYTAEFAENEKHVFFRTVDRERYEASETHSSLQSENFTVDSTGQVESCP